MKSNQDLGLSVFSALVLDLGDLGGALPTKTRFRDVIASFPGLLVSVCTFPSCPSF